MTDDEKKELTKELTKEQKQELQRKIIDERNQIKERLKNNLKNYVANECRKSKGGESYSCPICHSGERDDSAFHVNNDNTWHCFSNNHNDKDHGDIFELAGQINGLIEFKDQFEYICRYYNIDIEAVEDEIIESYTNTPKTNKKPNTGEIGGKELKTDNQTDVEEYENKYEQPKNVEKLQNDVKKFHDDLSLTNYHKQRGLTDEIVERFQIGYDKELKRLVIPYNENGTYYCERSVLKPEELAKYSGKHKQKLLKPKKEDHGSEIVFNESAMYNGQPIFVVEGQIDALSVIQAGFNAIATCGSNRKAFIRQSLKKAPEHVFILAFDNDTAGVEELNKIQPELEKHNLKYIIAKFDYEKYNGDSSKKCDCNDMYLLNLEQFKRDLNRNAEKAKRVKRRVGFRACNVSDYLQRGQYNDDILYFEHFKDRKTGFKNLDEHMTLYPGLSVLGGGSSVGKTTFAMNLCDNLMRSDESILYFAFEQEPIELVTKLLARGMFKRGDLSLTNIEIKNGMTTKELEAVKDEYIKLTSRFNVIRCTFNTTAETIKKYVETYIDATDEKPIVIVDYLQLIAPPEDFRGDARSVVDHVVKVLKTMQIENELFCMMISNFNRSSYNVPIGYESFKESGGIEYSCDYVFGLELAVLEDDSFYLKEKNGSIKNADTKDKRDRIFEESCKNPKEICFVCLKNRNGKQRFKCFFKYHMKYDAFVEDFESKYDKHKGEHFHDAGATPFDEAPAPTQETLFDKPMI